MSARRRMLGLPWGPPEAKSKRARARQTRETDAKAKARVSDEEKTVGETS